MIALVRFVFAVVRLNLCLLIVQFPLVFYCFGAIDPWRSSPTLVACLWLALPGLAAAFACFRDCSDFRFLEKSATIEDQRNSTVSYWRPGEEESIFKPFFRTWWLLLVKVLVSGFPWCCGIVLITFEIVVLYANRAMLMLLPVLIVIDIILIAALISTLQLLVEYPKSSYKALLRGGLFLLLKSWYLAPINIFILWLWIEGMIRQPLIVPMILASVILFAMWGNGQWGMRPVLKGQLDD